MSHPLGNIKKRCSCQGLKALLVGNFLVRFFYHRPNIWNEGRVRTVFKPFQHMEHFFKSKSSAPKHKKTDFTFQQDDINFGLSIDTHLFSLLFLLCYAYFTFLLGFTHHISMVILLDSQLFLNNEMF